ncbi:MAG: hypothetical protein A3E84_03690 [Gammaproteobacteria bacterium RIFCSPHIGHO2_12_FULL_42_13]|nr:MAG: hypothetical protein A3E84_03690 [Gammaproteobacteria bacterium RIFCSPHIGHO2_12_FULL_42_13]
MKGILSFLSRFVLLIIIVVGFSLAYYFELFQYLSFATLKQYRGTLTGFAEEHQLLTIASFMLIYIAAVALSVPGAVFLTLAGGFLFGPIATVYVVISATIGATILFLAVRSAIGDYLANKAKGWVAKMEEGFRKNAFNYLLVLRLVPLFPFWAINVVAALLAIPLRVFFIATLIGIIPGSFVYVMVGNSLNAVFQSDQTPDLRIIFTPAILLPLLALAVLALLPVIYKALKKSA